MKDPLHSLIDHDRAEREFLRWVILLALWHARPYGCGEHVIMGACRDIPIRTTFDQLRQELHSLAKRGLVDLKVDRPEWTAELSANGEAVVDFRTDCPADIARPNRW